MNIKYTHQLGVIRSQHGGKSLGDGTTSRWALSPPHGRGTLPPSHVLRAPPKILQMCTVGSNVYICILAQPYRYMDRTWEGGQRRRDGCPIIFGGHCTCQTKTETMC